MLITLALALLMTPTLEAPALAPISACSGEDLAYQALFDQYEEEYDSWREQLRTSKGLKERRELRKLDPAVLFGPRFEALADSGSGRSLLWLLDNARKVAERKELPDRKLEWYGRLFSSHLDADWFGDAIGMFTKERRDVSAEQIEAAMADALERAKGDAHARVLLGLARYRLAGKCNSGLTFYERLLAEHPDSSVAKDAQREYDRLTKFGMGAVPPDFKGETIDGQEISLSANVGKVTVIDFWGFW
jgi:hypothetical protein